MILAGETRKISGFLLRALRNSGITDGLKLRYFVGGHTGPYLPPSDNAELPVGRIKSEGYRFIEFFLFAPGSLSDSFLPCF